MEGGATMYLEAAVDVHGLILTSLPRPSGLYLCWEAGCRNTTREGMLIISKVEMDVDGVIDMKRSMSAECQNRINS